MPRELRDEFYELNTGNFDSLFKQRRELENLSKRSQVTAKRRSASRINAQVFKRRFSIKRA